MHRLFVALRPPLAVREQLIAAMGGIAGARWQDNDQLHVTLRYIGKVERDLAEDVAVALGGVCAPPLTLAVRGVGAFDDRGRTESVWAGVTPREPIAALHRKIDHALVRLGLPPEGRAYMPHVTLARLGKGAVGTDRFLADAATLATEPFRVEHFLLYESHLGRDRASYEPVARYPLTK